MDGTGRAVTAREAVGKFQDERSLEAAIDELQRAGFDRYDIGVWVSKLIDQHHTEYVAQQLARGGLLLWIRTTDLAREAKACQIMTWQAAFDVHIRDGATARQDFVKEHSNS